MGREKWGPELQRRVWVSAAITLAGFAVYFYASQALLWWRGLGEG